MGAVDFLNRPKTAAKPTPPATSSDPLPAAARQKLLALQGQAADARDAAASATRRIDDLKRGLNYSETPPDNAGDIEHEVARLQAVRQQQNIRHQVLSGLVANIGNWLASLPRGVTLAVAPAVKAKPQPGETVAEAVTRVRNELSEAQGLLRSVTVAPLPKQDLKALAAEQVAELAAKGAPRVDVDRGALSIRFSDARAFGVSPHAAAALAAWLDPEKMLRQLERVIDRMPEPPLAVSASEKQARIADIQRDIDRLERTEEALISTDGVEILRRRNASPAAVLGVVTR